LFYNRSASRHPFTGDRVAQFYVIGLLAGGVPLFENHSIRVSVQILKIAFAAKKILQVTDYKYLMHYQNIDKNLIRQREKL
jgi:hypothetical protein